jgi:hypothetical protein
MTADDFEPPPTDAEIEQAVWTALAAMLPTGQVEANMLSLVDPLADWTADDLRRLVGALAGLAAHFYRTLDRIHEGRPGMVRAE